MNRPPFRLGEIVRLLLLAVLLAGPSGYAEGQETKAEPEKTKPEAADKAEKAEKVEKAALANLLAVLGDAEIGECDIGNFTYREQSRKGYVVKPTTFRVPRFTKAK